MRNNVIVTLDTVVVRDSEPVAATVKESVVLLSLRAGAYFKFNTVGGQIWNLLPEPSRVGQIVDALAKTHQGDVEIMTRDVVAFVDSLIGRRLVNVVDPDRGR